MPGIADRAVPRRLDTRSAGLADRRGRLRGLVCMPPIPRGRRPCRPAVHARRDACEDTGSVSVGARDVQGAHVEDVRQWTESRFGVALPTERTVVFGASAGGDLALALGLRHPDVYGAIFCASPGAGYKPTEVMPSRIPRTYLVAGTQEPFFLENATRWAAALRDAGADVVMKERTGSHGGAFWRKEFPLMVARAFGRE
jgi:pimeloyl-ACP methyl ester carboxylesterase